jgi:hypothetical protein
VKRRRRRSWVSFLNPAYIFESGLLAYLSARDYPCPDQVQNKEGAYVGIYRDRPYVIVIWRRLVRLCRGIGNPVRSRRRKDTTCAMCTN